MLKYSSHGTNIKYLADGTTSHLIQLLFEINKYINVAEYSHSAGSEISLFGTSLAGTIAFLTLNPLAAKLIYLATSTDCDVPLNRPTAIKGIDFVKKLK